MKLLVLLLATSAFASKNELSPVVLDRMLAVKGGMQEGEYKAAWPQNDIAVTVDGFPISPAMGLSSWVAMAPYKKGAMLMGDLALLEDEVGPVERAAIDSGLQVTALHNHFLREVPKVMYMHIHGMGPADELAAAVRKTIDKAVVVRLAKRVTPPAAPKKPALDEKALDAALGETGHSFGPVRKYVIGREDVKLKEHGLRIDAFMGFNTWAAFEGTMKRAAVAGDIAMQADEVEPVIRELVTHGIEVTAIHNHMTDEEPRIFFLHYWGVGKALDLAAGLKAALEKTGRK
jgi:hypothetical protein